MTETLKERQHKRVQEIKEDRRTELTKLDGIRERLESGFKAKYVTVEIVGNPVDFRSPSTKEVVKIVSLAKLLDSPGNVSANEMAEALKEPPKLLAELSVSDELDEEFWNRIPFEEATNTLMLLMAKISEAKEEASKDIARFR